MFEKAKQLYQLQKQAKQIKKELADTHIEATEQCMDTEIKVVVDGEMKIVSVSIPEQLLAPSHQSAVQTALAAAANKGVARAQQIAAEKMQGIMGDMSGLMGGN